MMSSSWGDLTIGMRTTCKRKSAQLEIPWPTWLRMRLQVGPRIGESYRNTSVGNSGTTRKTTDSGRKETVAVPELEQIQEPHRGYF